MTNNKSGFEIVGEQMDRLYDLSRGVHAPQVNSDALEATTDHDCSDEKCTNPIHEQI